MLLRGRDCAYVDIVISSVPGTIPRHKRHSIGICQKKKKKKAFAADVTCPKTLGCRNSHAFIFLNHIRSDLALSCMIGQKSYMRKFQARLIFFFPLRIPECKRPKKILEGFFLSQLMGVSALVFPLLVLIEDVHRWALNPQIHLALFPRRTVSWSLQ